MRLMNDCSVHIRKDTFQAFATHSVKMFILQSHTTNAFQSLDLHLVGGFKTKLYCEFLLDNDNSAAGFIRRIFHNVRQIFGPDNVRSAFLHIDIRYNIGVDISVDRYLRIFDESVLPGSQSSSRFGDSTLGCRKCCLEGGSRFGWMEQDS
jgi:hypothetical protein